MTRAGNKERGRRIKRDEKRSRMASRFTKEEAELVGDKGEKRSRMGRKRQRERRGEMIL